MAYVVLHFGPYDFMNVLDYRINRLTGLIGRFVEERIKVYLKRSIHINRLTVEFAGYILFTCRITFMKYDGDGTDYCSDLAFKTTMAVFNRVYPGCFSHEFETTGPESEIINQFSI